MEVVENIDKMACLLQVPIVVWDSIKCTYMDYSWNSETTHSRRKAKCQALGVYWRDTVPGASWETLAAVLYQMGEQKALERVRIHLLPIKGTLTGSEKMKERHVKAFFCLRVCIVGVVAESEKALNLHPY